MKRYLILQDGTVYEGTAFGADAPSVGELVFNTGVVGYIETLTDPSYYGQIVMQTFPLIGNYGIIESDFEGACRVKGYVVREWCPTPSNFRSQYDLDTFLKNKGVPGICGVDTRAVTQHLREAGVMNAMLCDAPPQSLEALKGYAVRDAVKSVSTGATALFPARGEKRFNVTLIDYGAKANIERELQKRGCEVKMVPWDTPAEAILAGHPDGIMLSNGPGDPAENTACIAQIRKLLGKAPIFGICLGHQLTALAAGGRTEKLKYGHRGPTSPAGTWSPATPTSPARTTATRWCPTACPWERCASSTPTTKPARASNTPNTAPSPCSSTPRPAPDPWTRRSSSTGLLI